MILFTRIFFLLGPLFFYFFLLTLINNKKTIKFLELLKFFLIGSISMAIVKFLFFLKPNLYEGYTSFETFFFRVAPTEEISKMVTSVLIITIFKVKNKLKIVNIFVIVALSFSFIENLQYSVFGLEVVLVRRFTATISHMTYGYLMGYLYVYDFTKIGRLGDWLGTHRKLTKIFVFIPSLIVPCVIHGVWNYNLNESTQPMSVVFLIIPLMLMFIGLTYKKIENKN